MRKLLIFLLLLPLFCFASEKQFEQIVSFGDSLTDTGNIYKFTAHLLPKSPPYYNGRFSNGPVWLEHVYGHYFPDKNDFDDYNFSVGGACAVLSVDAPLPYSLSTQVNDYLYLHGYKNKDTTLYSIWIGGNNYVYGPKNVNDITTKAVDAIGDNVEKLIAHGGTMFLITNLPDLGQIPQAHERHNEVLLSALTVQHNEKLKAKVNYLQNKHPNTTIAYYDVARIFARMLNSPASFGIDNISQPCYTGGYVWKVAKDNNQSLERYLQAQSKAQGLQLSKSQRHAILNNPALREALVVAKQKETMHLQIDENHCDTSVFWDHIHPSKKVHEALAMFAINAIDEAGLMPKR